MSKHSFTPYRKYLLEQQRENAQVGRRVESYKKNPPLVIQTVLKANAKRERKKLRNLNSSGSSTLQVSQHDEEC